MRKKVLLVCTVIVMVISASAMMAGMQWSEVQDSCGKCKINDTDRKCGKCGGFMSSSNDKYLGKGWTQSTYTCGKCSHTAIYKCK